MFEFIESFKFLNYFVFIALILKEILKENEWERREKERRSNFKFKKLKIDC